MASAILIQDKTLINKTIHQYNNISKKYYLCAIADGERKLLIGNPV